LISIKAIYEHVKQEVELNAKVVSDSKEKETQNSE